MAEMNSVLSSTIPADAPLSPRVVFRIPLFALGMSLGGLLSLSYVLCVVYDLVFPSLAMNPVWALLLPGFVWITWPSFFLGLAENFAYGWYAALVIGPPYNYFAAKQGRN